MTDSEKWQPEVEQEAEAALIAAVDNDIAAVTSPNEDRSEIIEFDDIGAYVDTLLDNDIAPVTSPNEDPDVADTMELDDIGANVDGTTDRSEIMASQVEPGERPIYAEVIEEEIVDLVFEKVKPKLETHSMHCPNCKSEITKVVLRPKVLSYGQEQPALSQHEPEPHGLLGCLSFLSLFSCSDDGCLNIFKIRKESSNCCQSPPSSGEKAESVLYENDADTGDILEFDDVNETTNCSESSVSQVDTGKSSKEVGQVVEEPEIVELEFEKVEPKLATQTMHCPNCKSEITKVVLRRKVLSYRPPAQQVPQPVAEVTSASTAVGFIFFSSLLFPWSESRTKPALLPSGVEEAKPVLYENDSLLSIVRKGNSKDQRSLV